MKHTRLAVLTFVILADAVIPSRAQVVAYNSFGPGNSYNSGIVWAVSGASTSGGYRGQAQFFTPDISGYFYSVMLATYHVSGSGLSNFYLAQDSGSGTPGTILESFTSVANVNGLLTLDSTATPLLQAGTNYWICDEPTAGNSYNGWYENSQGVTGFAFERSEWSWSAIPSPSPGSGVFEVNVTPVPEPSALALCILCGSCLLLLSRRNKPVAVNGQLIVKREC